MKFILSLFFPILVSFSIFAQKTETEFAINNYHRYYADGQKIKDPVKEQSIKEYRQYYSTHGYRLNQLAACKLTWQECVNQLAEDGQFKDMVALENRILDEKLLLETFFGTENVVANFLVDAHNRIWRIAEAYKNGNFKESDEKYAIFLKSILHYGAIEIGRSNTLPRFHASCFAIPTAAVNTYFFMLTKMDQVEAGTEKNEQLVAVCEMLKTLALQAWTQPLRKDETDNNVVQIDRFRKHVWWVGGNALAYRSLLPVAFMYKSIPMVDLVAEVSQKCISTTSQNTYDEAFWTEGFTADGAAWGHGQQCLIWGYPIDGTSNALAMLNSLNGSPWAKTLSRENVHALFNFFRGANWYYYKGYKLPGLDRTSMRYDMERNPIRYVGMLNTLINEWKESFSSEELSELKQLLKEGSKNDITMGTLNDGVYSGTRWFFNNDDLMKKNDAYHVMVNMASVRCDGLESAPEMADKYNFFTADGATLFQKNGDEYRTVFGAWDVTAMPGVTARQGMDKITPVTNWRGYCSKFNFAGAATNGGVNAVAGFIFEKMNGSDKNNVNDRGTNAGKNPTIYGVKAHKSYFMLGDYFVALGAGVSNLHPEMEGTIRTTIDQTAKTEDVQIISNGLSKPMTEGIHDFVEKGKPVWVMQNKKFAYTILPDYSKRASFVCENKKTDWVKMNNENANVKGLPETVEMLTLWIDHGQKVVNGTYGYVVYAGANVPNTKLPFTVLQNDTLAQAIQSTDQTITEVVFYKGNTPLKTKKLVLSASAPCVLLIESKGKGRTLSVNDPQMDANLKQIQLLLNGETFSIDMPQGELCGKPVTIKL